MEIDTILQGDCLGFMATMPDESVDLVVTDPPYGIKFMGKSWDKALPSVDVWRECLRVLKPGAFAFVMCIPRQDCLSRMIINLEDAGFMVNFSPILWAYAQGFPKASSIAKNIDKKVDKRIEKVYNKYYKNMEDLLCNLGNANNAEMIFNTTLKKDISIILADDSAQAHVIINTKKTISKQSILPDSSHVSDAEILSEKSRIATGISMPKSDFVLINVCEKTPPKTSRLLNAIIAELSLGEAPLISSQPPITVPRNAGLTTEQKPSGVDIVVKSLETPRVPIDNTVLSNALILQCENIMDRIRADEALRIELGNQMSSNETAINVSYAGLIDALKRTIFSQSKTFQNLDTTSATEVLTAMTVIITPSTMECLILFMADMWEINLGEKEIKTGSYLSRFIDRRAGVEREVVGIRPVAYPDSECWGIPNINSQGGKIFGAKSALPEGDGKEAGGTPITAPATPEAKALDGAYAGYQPKPAYEVIIVAMKPCTEKTYLDQALANGHGCTQLDAGRIPYEGKQPSGSGTPGNIDTDIRCRTKGNGGNITPAAGRFAPNLLASDDALNDGNITKSSGGEPLSGEVNRYGVYGSRIRERTGEGVGKGDSGSFSRYFSLDAWAEANLPDSVKRTFPFLIVPKASKSEKNAGLEGLEDKDMYGRDGSGGSLECFGSDKHRIPPGKSKNYHPTVKPIKLMSYLIAIGSRPGDVVLDPYAGSCTTGVAAALLDRRYILMELDAEYAGMGPLRIAWHVEQQKEEEQAQLTLDFASET